MEFELILNNGLKFYNLGCDWEFGPFDPVLVKLLAAKNIKLSINHPSIHPFTNLSAITLEAAHTIISTVVSTRRCLDHCVGALLTNSITVH